MNTDSYTDDEITAFSQKLDEWGTTLPEREQILLLELVSRASHGADEVEGFSYGRFEGMGNLGGGAVFDAGETSIGLRPEHLFSGRVAPMTSTALGNVPGLRF